MINVSSNPNIALIKYWGNRDEDLRLPAADSISMTLDGPEVRVQIDHSDLLSVQSIAGENVEGLSSKKLARFQAHLRRVKEYLKILDIEQAIHKEVAMIIDSKIPQGIGLASSAAVFSAVAVAYAELIKPIRALTNAEISVIARLGSGSAARSVFGGFAMLKAGGGMSIDSSIAGQIADKDHWKLFDIVIAPEMHHKKVGSTEGHALAPTSPHFASRIAAIPRRQRECIAAILEKDFDKLRFVSEEDALDMHRVMETSKPPLKYLSDETHRIISEVETLRAEKHLPVLYTMDAGSTVHLIGEMEAKNDVLAYAKSNQNCTIFDLSIGTGAKLV